MTNGKISMGLAGLAMLAGAGPYSPTATPLYPLRDDDYRSDLGWRLTGPVVNPPGHPPKSKARARNKAARKARRINRKQS